MFIGINLLFTYNKNFHILSAFKSGCVWKDSQMLEFFGCKRKKYDIIYSIGECCAAATYLRKYKLRLAAGPFDWVTGTGLESRFDLLMNNMEGFCEKEDFEPIEPFDEKGGHYPYYNKNTHLKFLHDFPRGQSLDESFQGVKDKYERRIKKFYKNIRKCKNVLLIWINYGEPTPFDVIQNRCDAFSKKMAKNIDYIILEHKDQANETQKTQLSSHITYYSADINTGSFRGKIKNVAPIFKNLDINGWRRYNLIRKFARKFIRYLCFFIPIKNVRRKARRRLEAWCNLTVEF